MKLNRDDVVLLQGSSVAQTADGFSVTPEFVGNGRDSQIMPATSSSTLWTLVPLVKQNHMTWRA